VFTYVLNLATTCNMLRVQHRVRYENIQLKSRYIVDLFHFLQFSSILKGADRQIITRCQYFIAFNQCCYQLRPLKVVVHDAYVLC
jgi:hypothetical protein